MKKTTNPKAGDQFRVIVVNNRFNVGEIISLKEDDSSSNPFFWNADKSDYQSMYFSELEPLTKSVRDAQVGDIVVYKNSGYERMVLERGQKTVDLSYPDDFKKMAGGFTFDELEEDFTLKGAPEVVDDKTAKAMKLLKEAGYKITKE